MAKEADRMPTRRCVRRIWGKPARGWPGTAWPTPGRPRCWPCGWRSGDVPAWPLPSCWPCSSCAVALARRAVTCAAVRVRAVPALPLLVLAALVVGLLLAQSLLDWWVRRVDRRAGATLPRRAAHPIQLGWRPCWAAACRLHGRHIHRRDGAGGERPGRPGLHRAVRGGHPADRPARRRGRHRHAAAPCAGAPGRGGGRGLADGRRHHAGRGRPRARHAEPCRGRCRSCVFGTALGWWNAASLVFIVLGAVALSLIHARTAGAARWRGEP